MQRHAHAAAGTFVSLCLVLAPSGLAQAPPAASPPGAPGVSGASGVPGMPGGPAGKAFFRMHQITDPGMNGLVAATLLVPEGWAVEGGLNRNPPQLYSMPVMVDLKVRAPDGRGVRFFPSFSFEFNNNQPAAPFSATLGGNLYLPLPQSPGQWLQEMARAHPAPGVTDVQLVSETMDEALTQQVRQKYATLFQMQQQNQALAMQTGVGMEVDTQATRVVLTYQHHGQPIEETVLMTWYYVVTTYRGQALSGNWGIEFMRSARGPAGSDYLNDPEIMTILRSAQNNPAWDAEMNKYWTELARIRHQGQQERMAIQQRGHEQRMQTLRETNDIIMNGWQQRSAAQDASHARYIDTIREVTPYQTPTGQTVKLPSFYDHVYTDGNGRYLLNNNSLYDPNTDPAMNQQSWQRIEPTR